MYLQIIRLVAAVGAGTAVFLAFRWIWRQSPLIGAIVAAGILSRAVLGVLLFWLSYLGLPVLHSLQLGDGFWTVTADAKFYFGYAAAGAEAGVRGMNPGDASPFFVKTLAVWMSFVGVSPAAGLFLNVSLYVTLCALLVRICRPTNNWRDDLPCAVPIAAFSFSPVALIHATQPMKEDLFAFLIVLASLGVLWLTQALFYGKPAGRTRLAFTGGLAVLAAAVFGIAGIRIYYAAIICATLALVLATFTAAHRPRRRREAIRHLAASALILAAAGLSSWEGSGTERPRSALGIHPGAGRRGGDAYTDACRIHPHRRRNEHGRGRYASRPEARRRDGRRNGNSPGRSAGRDRRQGGSDGWGRPGHPRRSRGPVRADLAAAGGLGRQLSGRPRSAADCDLDTVFFDASVLACLILLYKRRAAIQDKLPFVVFALCSSVLTACLLAYVVTNFGSLFRIKTMIAVPIWISCVALGHARKDDATS